MLRIPRGTHIFAFSPEALPVLEADPGMEVLFETIDSWGGELQRPEDIYVVKGHRDRANPATGPVYLHGAQPGDALTAEILDIKLLEPIINKITPQGGLLAGEVQSPYCRFLELEGDSVLMPGGLRLPVRPMVGTIGTAPSSGSSGSVGNIDPGDHGGNMDHNDVRPGVTVYLPVRVPGALFALGDVHAYMGDGEVSGAGLDCPADVRVRLGLVKGAGLERPLIETEDAWVTCASSPDLLDAVRTATRDMVRLLSRVQGISLEDAFLLVSAAGDAHIGQSSGSETPRTARMRFPKAAGLGEIFSM